MPTRVTNTWLAGAARGLTSGALALTVLSGSGGILTAPGLQVAVADDLDCYNDKDLYNLPECVQQRANDAKEGNQQTSVFSPPPGDPGQQVTSGGGQQSGGGDQSQQSSGGGGQSSGSGNQSSGGGNQGQQQQSQQQPPSNDENDNAEKPHVSASDPTQFVLTLTDAGKQATDYGSHQGTDKYGQWFQQRYERDRSDGSSSLGPNVIDSKGWVTKDVDTAKALFKEQSAVKDFPERKEGITGPNETVKPGCPGEECAVAKAYFQDDSKLWQHLRYVIRNGKNVAVLYVFGRDDFFFDRKEKTNTWNGAGDWYPQTMNDRM